MRYDSFESFGVEIYEKGELQFTKYFDTIKEAIEYARDMGSALYGYKYITADKYGNIINRL